MGTDVKLVLRVADDVRHRITSVDLVLREGAEEERIPMISTWHGFETTVSLAFEPHVAFYYFELLLDTEQICTFAKRPDNRSTSGAVAPTGDSKAKGFQISVYEPAFATPSWLRGAIMYQVLPDRFSRGTGGVREAGIDYHERMGRPAHVRASWDEPLTWEEGTEYDPVDFYGGTLDGIREKISYLDSLGVEALYLNPVFEARSYHRYDTSDYERIDPLLGTDDSFRLLTEEAAGRGISVVLDAVLSHTGRDSRYFNAHRAYEQPGAAQGAVSPYYSWYDFTPQEDGAPYRSWWGDLTLPEVDERNESWQHYILGGILPKWLAMGAQGYRLDVADEIPDEVLEKLRTAVKSANPEACIIGEVWEDATTKKSYGAERTYALGRALDSVMNYPLRKALIDFATGKTDAFQLATFLKLQQSNYPEPLYHCLMNLLSSHDVERIRTVLALGKEIRHNPREDQFNAQREITPAQDVHAAQLQQMIAGLLYALPGCPCIYYGDERGMQGGSDPFCRAPMVWETSASRKDAGKDITASYRAFGKMRKDSACLRYGSLSCAAIDEDALFVVREHEGKLAFACTNRSADERFLVVDLNMVLPSLTPDCGLPASQPGLSLEDGIARILAPAESTVFFLP